MGLKETWVDRIDGVDDADAEDINTVARAVIALEEANGDIDEALDRIITIQNELLGIITFTIDGTEYNADKGMTWSEWCDSDYNTIDAYHNKGVGYIYAGALGTYGSYICAENTTEAMVRGDEKIIKDKTYYACS